MPSNTNFGTSDAPIVGGAVEHLSLSSDGKQLYADVLVDEQTGPSESRVYKPLFVWNVPALIQAALDAKANRQTLTTPIDRIKGVTGAAGQVAAAIPQRYNGAKAGEYFGWMYGIGTFTESVTVSTQGNYGDVIGVDLEELLIANKLGLTAPRKDWTPEQQLAYGKEFNQHNFSDFNISTDQIRSLTLNPNLPADDNKQPGMQLVLNKDNTVYSRASTNSTTLAELKQTGVLFLAPTITKADEATLRAGKTLADKATVSLSFWYGEKNAAGVFEQKQGIVNVKAHDYDKGSAVFFGDRPLDNPGYSAFTLHGEVGVDKANDPLDVYRVEQRLKYLGFPAMGYVPPGATNTNQIQDFSVDGKFEYKESLSALLFQKVVNGATDGVISQNGGAVKWLNAYNAPHWMDIGSQMAYQGGYFSPTSNSNASIPGWNNAQNATTATGAVEKYGTSWTRDLMRAKQYASSLYNLDNAIQTGSLFNGAVDANYGYSLTAHSSHGDGMNFDLGIARSFLSGIFLTSMAAAGDAINPALAAQLAPAAGAWSNVYAAEIAKQLPQDSLNNKNINYQRDAMREFLSIYSITRNNGTEANGWDDLVAHIASGSSDAKKKEILAALFGNGTADGSLVSSVLVGGDSAETIKNAKDAYNLADGSKQAELLRMGEVLRALGVPRRAAQVPVANTTYNVDAHFNHFHLNIRPPVRVDIEATNNLQAATEELPIMLAAAPSLTTSDAGSSSAPVPAAPQQVKYDAVYSMCGPMHSADQVPYNIERDNGESPMTPIYSVMFGIGMSVEQIKATPVIIKVLKVPTHGVLVPSDASSYDYHANPGYLGSDQMVFEVETMGKKFKVIQTVVIHNSGNLDFPTDAATKEFDRVCPSDKGSSLDIIKLPAEGFASDEELANLHSMLSFALGSEYAGNGGSLNIADLPNAAIGQTTGSTITLDTNASGYGWFIDTTPTDNSEYLPTSNPNEWVAKAGSAAAGKMDMLSVLLHEYGHALGINHSADPNDFMGTTLTAGVRKLPSAQEMALMQGLVAEAKAGLTESTPTLTRDSSLSLWERVGVREGGGNSLPTFPTLPLGTSFIGFIGLLRSSRYGGVSIVPDASTLVTKYAVAANATLTNGSLNAIDGWSTQGGVEIIPPSTGSGRTGGATLNEVSGSQTRLSQVFLLNPTDRFLSFTLSGTALDDLPHPNPLPGGEGVNVAQGADQPLDAFEVALLDANTGASLLSGTGQTRTDAFLNLQADGSVNSTATSAASGLPTFGAQNLADCVTGEFRSRFH